MSETPFATILVVDDSRTDVRLLELWLRNSRIVRAMHAVPRGREALAFLRREGAFSQAIQPHLILLDVHLPDMYGWELLTELRQDESWQRIPVIMLSGSMHPDDERRAAQCGATRYRGKPFDAEEFAALVQEIDEVILASTSHSSDDSTTSH